MQNFKFAKDLGPRANLFLCVLGRIYLSESFWKRNIRKFLEKKYHVRKFLEKNYHVNFNLYTR